MPSQNTDLANCREATWVPNSQSRASWSRRTTPASTPRATPMATPLATPHHSPPREGAYFPQSFTRRDHVKPPPGFSSRPQQLHDNTQATPKAFNAQMNPQSIPQNFNSEVSYGSQMEFGFQPVTPSPWGGKHLLLAITDLAGVYFEKKCLCLCYNLCDGMLSRWWSERSIGSGYEFSLPLYTSFTRYPAKISSFSYLSKLSGFVHMYNLKPFCWKNSMMWILIAIFTPAPVIS